MVMTPPLDSPANNSAGVAIQRGEKIEIRRSVGKLINLQKSLEQKAIDGQENPVSVIAANKFWEVQKFIALTNHQYNPQSLIFSKKVWDTLSAAEKKVLQDAASEAAQFQRKVNRDAAATQLADLKKAGMQVTELSAAEQAKLRDKFKPVIDKHGAAIAATVAELQAELAKLRK